MSFKIVFKFLSKVVQNLPETIIHIGFAYLPVFYIPIIHINHSKLEGSYNYNFNKRVVIFSGGGHEVGS